MKQNMVALATARTPTQTLAHAGMLLRMTPDGTGTERPPMTSENIRERRKALGLNQTELGQLLDPPVSQRTVTAWENDTYSPQGDKREQLAQVLGLSMSSRASVPAEVSSPPATVTTIAQMRTEANIVQAIALLEDALRSLRTERGEGA